MQVRNQLVKRNQQLQSELHLIGHQHEASILRHPCAAPKFTARNLVLLRQLLRPQMKWPGPVVSRTRTPPATASAQKYRLKVALPSRFPQDARTLLWTGFHSARHSR
jgi:hypothetical protein